MKYIYSIFSKSILILFLSVAVQKAAAQTTLVAGDIAFTGYISAASNTDEFSFVLLKNVTAGTVINFTDNAWLNTGVFRSGEQTVTWTTTTALAAGTEIKISGTTNPTPLTPTATLVGGASAGTCTGTMTSLSTSGDQVLAYQGTVASPTFISGIHMNVYSISNFDVVNTDAATWDNTNSNNTSASALPPGLTTGTTAIWVGTFDNSASEFDNANFNCLSGPINTIAAIKAIIYNPANWTKTNGAPTGGMVTPTGCNFLAPVPVTLIDFSGKLNADNTATLQWEVAQQVNISEYVIEKSIDGTTFQKAGSVADNSSLAGTYSFTDRQLLNGTNYYRLKIVERSAKMEYSNVVSLNVKSGKNILVFPNPVVNELTIKQAGREKGTAVLLSRDGKRLMQIALTGQPQKINMQGFAPGMYFLKMGNGAVYKVVKQ